MEKDVAQRDGRDGSSGWWMGVSRMSRMSRMSGISRVVEDGRLTRDRFLYSISRDAVLG